MQRSSALKIQIGAAIAALAMVSFAILQVSQAAFSDTTDTAGNWGSATVALSDDDGTGQVEFTNDATMVPGDSDQACITVQYDGDVASTVKLYGSTTTTSGTNLGEYLDLSIEEVTVQTEGDCAGATSDSQLYTGTLSGTGSFTDTHPDWSNGLSGTFAPATNAEAQTYRVTVTLQDNNAAQGLDTTSTFTWEAQNA